MNQGLDLHAAMDSIEQFVSHGGVGGAITQVEARLRGATTEVVAKEAELTDSLLRDALAIKAAVGDLNSLIHAAGMVAALRIILEPGESIESLSLGAGPTGVADLVTTHRVAEFKFNVWRGHDGGRQKALVPDIVRLAHDTSGRRRYLYLVDTARPLKWLTTTRTKLTTLLAGTRHNGLLPALADRYGASISVSQFWSSVRDSIEVVNLGDLDPVFALVGVASATDVAAMAGDV